MAKSPEELAHQEWIGFVQPTGLVVSIPALLAAGAQINRNMAPVQSRLLACLERDARGEPRPELRNLAAFATGVLDWSPEDLQPVPPSAALPPEFAGLEVVLPDYQETLRPTHVVREPEPRAGQSPWLLLVQALAEPADLDRAAAAAGRHWQASPQARFERLLRETGVPAGLLATPGQLRLVYAPRGESSGYATFDLAHMTQVAGRPILAALHMLLSAERLFTLPTRQRLPAILTESRKYQSVVSTQLAGQVLAALYELLRGLQAANDARGGALLRQVIADDPNQVYGGLLTVLLRLVFLLYAEDRGLMPGDPVYTNHYSVSGLFERLRADAGRYPDTMDQRYGAWAQLLALFRLVYSGGQHGAMKLPPRQGYLFDPQRYPFLEGRERGGVDRTEDQYEGLPRISDGVLHRVLENLLILDGERLSYRTLDVEQIGSVYETIMGFNLEVAQGRSIAIKPKKTHGAPTTINLEELLAIKGNERAKWLKDQADQELTGKAATELKAAETVEELLAALERKIAREATPNAVPKGSVVFQPSDERRRSGSHYTPRSLTEPIVRTTLKPVLEQLGESPTPEQILSLKVCDPAMGSGAFLVEACRQLGDSLVKAWHAHKALPALPPDEDEILHARRLVAQRCLYGVDKNRLAVDLAKLSLWLATLAKDHPFTFLDHSLRCGDSLVGLSRAQIAGFHWAPKGQKHLLEQELAQQIARATDARRKILAAPEATPYGDQQQALAVAEDALERVRRLGDLVIAAFFAADKPKAREQKLGDYLALVTRARGKEARAEDIAEWLRIVGQLRGGERPIEPFHWEIEFPEVFGHENGGFDAFVGNPPFMGGKNISGALGSQYLDSLRQHNSSTGGQTDLVAYFFRSAFRLLSGNGCFGLIATNTICQGDTRKSGLLQIRSQGGVIYEARKRVKWPGAAAVTVSVVHVGKRAHQYARVLNGTVVGNINAFLLDKGPDEDPAPLSANGDVAFMGEYPYGAGFLFCDSDPASSPIEVMNALLASNPRNAEGSSHISEEPKCWKPQAFRQSDLSSALKT
jgi:hypothetical protein